MTKTLAKDIYVGRDFEAGPRTYSSAELVNLMVEAAGGASSESRNILDAMSGPGKVTKAVCKSFPQARFHSFDLRHPLSGHVFDDPEQESDPTRKEQIIRANEQKKQELLSKWEGAKHLVQADALVLPYADGVFDIAFVRYSIKDIKNPRAQQEALAEFYRVLKPGGKLVFVDMYAYPGTEEALTQQHSLKQVLATDKNNGTLTSAEAQQRLEEEGPTCNIPTLDTWVNMLSQAGFDCPDENVHANEYVSTVGPADWYRGNQIHENHMPVMVESLHALGEICPAYNVRVVPNKETGMDELKIDYPIAIIGATKPEILPLSPPSEPIQ
jgi:SAM-dependent methyltransferase